MRREIQPTHYQHHTYERDCNTCSFTEDMCFGLTPVADNISGYNDPKSKNESVTDMAHYAL